MWTPGSAISGSGTSYFDFGESSTGAVEDLAPGRSDVHLAPPPPPRSDSPHT
ncbi:hypothetical protein EXIGLDRAFT_727966 [Exidia glandulosa HHB12029]|uniref:Uncharacterized protein n=1 Tax=Exidia glandulosa HHB12029 TaxID=1314781 RepID=A0A165D4J7_EXIGL|nr:hypothetical protein EXIGLDRAFT_727966 [Exidia glandulosa HHB12029]